MTELTLAVCADILKNHRGEKVFMLVSDCGPLQMNKFMVMALQHLVDRKVFAVAIAGYYEVRRPHSFVSGCRAHAGRCCAPLSNCMGRESATKNSAVIRNI
jgi:hypothetical protein